MVSGDLDIFICFHFQSNFHVPVVSSLQIYSNQKYLEDDELCCI